MPRFWTASNDHSTPSPGWRRSRAYACCVVAIAVVLWGLALVPVSSPAYRSSRTVSRDTARSAQPAQRPARLPSAARLRRQLTSPVAIEVALRKPGGPDLPVMPREFPKLAEAVRVEFLPSNTAWNRVRIEVTHRRAEVAEFVSRRLAEQVLSTIQTSTDISPLRNAERSARRAAREARHYERLARHALDSYWSANRYRLTTSAAVAQTDVEQPGLGGPAPAVASEAYPQTPTINPEWTELDTELAGLRQQLSIKLARLTPAHPEVQQLGYEISTLEDQLRQVAKYITPRSLESTMSPPVAGESAGSAASDEQLEQLRRDYRQSVEATNAAEHEAQQRLVEVLTRSDRSDNWSTRADQPRRLAAGAPPPRWLLGVVVLALMLGAVATRIPGRTAPIATTDQVQSCLGMPVVALLSVPTDRPANRGGSSQPDNRIGWRSLVVVTAEMAVVAITVVVLIAMASGNPVLNQWAANPPAAPADSLYLLLGKG